MRFKKIFAALLAASMVFTWAGCSSAAPSSEQGSSETSESTSAQEQSTEQSTEQNVAGYTEDGLPIYDEPVTLLIWGGVPAENGPQEVVDNYNELNKDRNITIEYYRYVNDDNGNIALDTALSAGEKMDMFISYTPARRDSRAKSGKVMDITEICEKLDVDLIRDFGSIASGNIMDGKIYSIPTMKYMDLLIFNKDMLDANQLEVPTTDSSWQDIRDIAKALTTEENGQKTYGFYLGMGGDFFPKAFVSTASQYSVPYMNEDGTASTWVSNPAFKEAYQTAYDMMYTDQTTMDWPTMISEKTEDGTISTAMYCNGQIAGKIAGTHVIRDLINLETFPHDFVTAFAPIPRLNAEQDAYYASVEANDHISVNINCEYPEEAVRYIKWYYTEGYDPMIKNGRLPLYQDYDADRAMELMIGENEDLIDAESFKNTVFGKYDDFNLPLPYDNMSAASKINKEETEAYFLDQIDLDTMLKNMEERTNETIE